MLLNTKNGEIVFQTVAERDEFYKTFSASVFPAFIAQPNTRYLRLLPGETIIAKKPNKQLVIVVGKYESVPFHYEVRGIGDTECFSYARYEQALAFFGGRIKAEPKEQIKRAPSDIVDVALDYCREKLGKQIHISRVRLEKLLAQDGLEGFEGHYTRHCAWWLNHRAKKAGK